MGIISEFVSSVREIVPSASKLHKEQGKGIQSVAGMLSDAFSTIDQITGNIHDVIFVLDMNLNYVYVSSSVKFIRGYETDEVLEQKFFDALTPSSLNLTKKTLSEVLEMEILEHKDPLPRTLQLEVKCKDGSTVWTEMKLSFIRDKAGKMIGFLGVMLDITRNKQLEEELRGSEEKYRIILENIQEAYYEFDLAGNLTFFNDTLCRLLGYPREELMGLNNRRYTNKEEFKKVFQAYNKVYKTGEPNKEFSWRIIRKDGAKRYIEGSISLLKDSSDQLKGFKGILRDITERKWAEEALHESEVKFRNLTDAAQDVIVTTDLRGSITYANPSAETIAGGMSIVGVGMRDFLPPASLEQQVNMHALFKSGFSSETLSYESKIQRPQDHYPIYFEVRSTGLLNRGEPSGFLFVARDATGRKRTEEEIRIMAIMDTLTGLYNRRGFITLAEQQIKTTGRSNKKLLLFFIDLDGLKLINDTLGHAAGDGAIKRTASILKRTFRESDIICRLAGDEFAALVMDNNELPDVILKRLQCRTDEENAASDLTYQISMSIGVADYDPSAPCSIQELLSRADKLMYQQKKEKKQSQTYPHPA